MYKDLADAIKSKKDVEQGLSKLESRTAEILQKVKKAHENGDPGIWLTLVEGNRLRKFLFIMKYRGPGFCEKYFSEDPQTYDSEDKHLLRAYIANKGMKKPRDVWLHNLRAILDINMDAKGDWMIKLPEVMFPEDASLSSEVEPALIETDAIRYGMLKFAVSTLNLAAKAHDQVLFTDKFRMYYFKTKHPCESWNIFFYHHSI